MASLREFPNGTWQVVVKNKWLKALTGLATTYATFQPDEKAKAEAWGVYIETKLKAGVVPDELKPENRAKRGGDRISDEAKSEGNPALTTRLLEITNQYCKGRRISDSDDKIYTLLVAETENPRLSEMTLQWAERLVAKYKEPDMQLAPGTIRKRIGALTRAVDWFQRQSKIPHPISFGKSLGRGYSHYPNGEKKDVARERLYKPGEEAKVMGLWDGTTEIPAKKKPYAEDILDERFERLYLTIRNTGMRLKEAYWLRVEQVNFTTGLIQVDGTKGHFGEIKKRHVPMLPIVRETLKAAVKDKAPGDLIWHYWDGEETKKAHAATSSYLSAAFSRLFECAGLKNFKEHDLRHVATVQWVEMKSKKTGNWLFSENEILQLMGWTNRAMLDRYIKGHRAENLSSRLDELMEAA